MSRALWICGALALMAGCNRPNWSTPVDAYRSFLRALAKGETDVAFGALSTPAREALQARAKALSEASGGAVRDDAAALFFVNARDAVQVTEITLVKQEGDRAVVSVKGPGGPREVQMVREAEGWRIALELGDTGAEGAETAGAQPATATGRTPADGGVPPDGGAAVDVAH